MTDLTLRPVAPADIPALSLLGVAAFTAKFWQLYRPEDLLPFLLETHSEAALTRDLANPARLIHLAERSGTLVGWVKLGLACGFPDHARGARVMELKQLYTAPNAQGSGIGAALMDWAMAEFASRGADEVQLSVWSENHGAQRFYARYGFEKQADITFRVGQQLDQEYLFARML
ncbi:GNAT family N-acetyltransferase [Novosphingobium flavum]|uniref:GNAT family N-acetyltransferase n=1 Tax=Novosphingobium flavum TaxID=1778672 RepID=A0A7X1KKA7_9SPHN|nr:GNAT family N-acetyltransferase [Novosphingobium flavum]MBC2664349.1 GNAT family N-acetyltransferase [Novosphingobium flavum]